MLDLKFCLKNLAVREILTLWAADLKIKSGYISNRMYLKVLSAM